MKVGLIKIDGVKKMAAEVKKRVEGCKHCTALEQIARSTGFANYAAVHLASAEPQHAADFMPGTREERFAAWRDRLVQEFSAEINSVFDEIELQRWFSRVFVNPEQLVVDTDGDQEILIKVVDPCLRTADWRDNEFRRRVQQQIDRHYVSVRRTRLDDGRGGQADVVGCQ